MFRLAGHLGRSVEELLRSISPREIAAWRAFDSLEPIGWQQLNWQFAALKNLVLLASPKFDHQKSSLSMKDFILNFDPTPEDNRTEQEKAEASAEQMKAFLSQFGKTRIKSKTPPASDKPE